MVLALVLTWALAGVEDVESEMRRVIGLLNRGRASEALPVIESLAARAPGSLPVDRLRGRVWTATGREIQWRARLAAEVSGSSNPRPLYLLAELPGPLATRAALLDEALARDAEYVPALILRARLALESGEPSRCAGWLELAARLEPESSDVFIVRALLSNHGGRIEDARADLQLAIAADPGNATARLLLAESLVDAGRISEAEKHLEEARYLRPGDVALYRLRARIALGRKRVQNAVEVARMGLKYFPEDLRLHRIEVRALLLGGELTRAEKALADHEALWQEQAPDEWRRFACELGWQRRDEKALSRALSDWPREDSNTRVRYEGYLSYLRGDLPGLEDAMERFRGDQGDLDDLRGVLASAARRDRSRVGFSLGIAAALIVVVLLGIRMVRRR